MVKKRKKVLVALSGGIDSAVSAYLLLKQGYEVEAAFMKNWTSTEGLLKNECPWLQDRQDALRVAAFLRIPLHTLDFEKQYETTVLDYFFKEYKAGRTPNPDVMCNKEIKFKLLYNWAIKHGFDFMATGHYARVGTSDELQVTGDTGRPVSPYTRLPAEVRLSRTEEGHPSLFRSHDEFKDQTYFIYNIRAEQLPRLLFPIGGMKKPAVRVLARKIGLPNAGKKESMGLCFVGKIRLKDFLLQKLRPKPGKIILAPPVSLRGSAADRSNPSIQEKIASRKLNRNTLAMTDLSVIGTHQGLHNYTIGQRQGIKVGGSGPFYVLGKDLKRNVLYVTNDANDERLETKEVELHSVNWIGLNSKSQMTNSKLLGRYRHQGELVPLKMFKIGKDHYKIIFKIPQKAIASGQSLVLYRGKECVGGGVVV